MRVVCVDGRGYDDDDRKDHPPPLADRDQIVAERQALSGWHARHRSQNFGYSPSRLVTAERLGARVGDDAAGYVGDALNAVHPVVS